VHSQSVASSRKGARKGELGLPSRPRKQGEEHSGASVRIAMIELVAIHAPINHS
jgi:hypothetical protein